MSRIVRGPYPTGTFPLALRSSVFLAVVSICSLAMRCAVAQHITVDGRSPRHRRWSGLTTGSAPISARRSAATFSTALGSSVWQPAKAPRSAALRRSAMSSAGLPGVAHPQSMAESNPTSPGLAHNGSIFFLRTDSRRVRRRTESPSTGLQTPRSFARRVN